MIGSPTRQGESPLCPRVGSLGRAHAGEQILFPQKPLAVAAPLTELDRAGTVRTAAGLAHIAAQILRFSLLPLTARRRFPLHIVGLLGFQGIIIALQSLHVKLGAAIRTFHLLRSAVKLDGTAAAWAFILL